MNLETNSSTGVSYCYKIQNNYNFNFRTICGKTRSIMKSPKALIFLC